MPNFVTAVILGIGKEKSPPYALHLLVNVSYTHKIAWPKQEGGN